MLDLVSSGIEAGDAPVTPRLTGGSIPGGDSPYSEGYPNYCYYEYMRQMMQQGMSGWVGAARPPWAAGSMIRQTAEPQYNDVPLPYAVVQMILPDGSVRTTQTQTDGTFVFYGDLPESGCELVISPPPMRTDLAPLSVAVTDVLPGERARVQARLFDKNAKQPSKVSLKPKSATLNAGEEIELVSSMSGSSDPTVGVVWMLKTKTDAAIVPGESSNCLFIAGAQSGPVQVTATLNGASGKAKIQIK